MPLTSDEKAVLRLLIAKELDALAEDNAELFISNSPFLTKVALDAPDVPFLKSEAKYHAFLKRLQKKL